jgi:ABC-type oligopeptide transport system substrate-binding subunit
MQNMNLQKIFTFALVLSSLILLARCQSAAPTQSIELFGGQQLTPYQTATSTATITPTPVNAPTETPLPTITPRICLYG